MRAPACNAGLRPFARHSTPWLLLVSKCIGAYIPRLHGHFKGAGRGSRLARRPCTSRTPRARKSFQGKRTASGDPAPAPQAVHKQAGGIPRRARCHHLERHFREPHARTRGRPRRVQRVAFRAKASQSLRRSLTTETLRPRGPRKAGRHPEGPKAYPPAPWWIRGTPGPPRVGPCTTVRPPLCTLAGLDRAPVTPVATVATGSCAPARVGPYGTDGTRHLDPCTFATRLPPGRFGRFRAKAVRVWCHPSPLWTMAPFGKPPALPQTSSRARDRL